MTNTQTMEGKVYTVTGAAGGIGLDIVLRLAARGASLSIADVKSEELRNAEQAVTGSYPDCKMITEIVDVRRRDHVDAWIVKTLETFGKIDGCVNSAGEISPTFTLRRVLDRTVSGVSKSSFYLLTLLSRCNGSYGRYTKRLGRGARSRHRRQPQGDIQLAPVTTAQRGGRSKYCQHSKHGRLDGRSISLAILHVQARCDRPDQDGGQGERTPRSQDQRCMPVS